MRVPTLALLGWAAMFALGCRAPEPTPEPTPDAGQAPPGFTEYGATPCEPVGDIQFICDLISPEDLAILHDSPSNNAIILAERFVTHGRARELRPRTCLHKKSGHTVFMGVDHRLDRGGPSRKRRFIP